MKQYDSVQFLSIFECQALPHKRKAPRRKAKPSVENFLATVLHVNMASQAECESCFHTNVLIFTPFSGALVNATALTLLLESFAEKKLSVAAFQLTLPDSCAFPPYKNCHF